MNTDGQVHLGHTIRTMRKAAGYSLRELARRTGVSPAYLSGIERGTLPTPTHARLQAVARALEIPEEHLAALSERLSPELTGFLVETPEAGRFLRAAQEAGLQGEDFSSMVAFLKTSGREAWQRQFTGFSNGQSQGRSMPLRNLLEKRRIWCRVEAASKADLLAEMTRALLRGTDVVESQMVLEMVLAREEESSTGVGGGVALPHAAVPELTENILGVATLSRPIDFEAIDGVPVKLVFLLLGGEEKAVERTRVLARVAQLCVRPGFLDSLADSKSVKVLHSLLRRADAEED